MDVVFQDQARDRREQERQRKFRDRFVAETPPWYHGAHPPRLHAAGHRRRDVAVLEPDSERRLGMAIGYPDRAVRQLDRVGRASLHPASPGEGTGDDLQAPLHGASPVLHPSRSHLSRAQGMARAVVSALRAARLRAGRAAAGLAAGAIDFGECRLHHSFHDGGLLSHV